MNREDLLREMRTSIGTQAPLVFFEKMTDLLGLLFDRIDELEETVSQLKTRSALSIQWEPKVASDMLAKEIEKLKTADRDTYALEIATLRRAYAENIITQEYVDFCRFWQDNLGYHPFLDYDR